MYFYRSAIKNVKNKIKTTASFAITWRRRNYLEKYLTKQAQDLYAKNYKSLLKEITGPSK